MFRVPPSLTVAESLPATGGSLTSSTVKVSVALVDSVPSLAVTRIVRVDGVSASSGVPLKVRVLGVKLSQSGRSRSRHQARRCRSEYPRPGR